MNKKLHRQVAALLVILLAVALSSCQRVYWVTLKDSPGTQLNVLPAVAGSTGQMTNEFETALHLSGLDSIAWRPDSFSSRIVPIKGDLSDTLKGTAKDKLIGLLQRLAQSALPPEDKKLWSSALKTALNKRGASGGGAVFIVKADSGYNTGWPYVEKKK